MSEKTLKQTKKARKPKVPKPKKTGEGDQDSRKRKRHNDSYYSYIYKVLKQVHPDTGISRKAMITMNNVSIFVNILSNENSLLQISLKELQPKLKYYHRRTKDTLLLQEKFKPLLG